MKETQLKKRKREEEKEQQKNGKRKAQANARRQVRESSSVSNDGISDGHVCHSTEPEGLTSSTVFWIDCDKCSVWVHNYCVFQKNDVSGKYVCSDCSEIATELLLF